RPGGAAVPAGRGLTVGDAGGIVLSVSPLGRIVGFRAGGHDLAAGIPPGGLSLGLPGKPEVPLGGFVRADGKSIIQRVSGGQGGVVLTYRPEAKGVVLQLKVDRVQDGAPGEILLRLPFRSGGWRWVPGGAPEVIAIDGTYHADAPGGMLAPVTLGGPGISLKIAAPTAA